MIGLTEAKSFLDVIGKYFSVLFILGLTLLFMPINLAEKMGVLIFVKQYQSWISVTTLASGAFFIYYLIKIICSKISFYLKEQRRKKIVLRFLKTLSEAEVELLQNCVKKNEQTILLEFSNPIAQQRACCCKLVEQETF